MGYIYDINSVKIGKIQDDGDVYDKSGEKRLGRVHGDGTVYDSAGHKIGHYDPSGKVFEHSQHIGNVHSDGQISDLAGHHLGRAEAPHLEGGGAAMLLLIR